MGRGFLVSRGMAVQPPGEENEPAVADADRAEHREAAFGQTCPIETAVDAPCQHWKERRWRPLALLGLRRRYAIDTRPG